ncbi:MAG: hypothetical protein HON94_09915 [Methylococcales bacterium]|nr:hypothetical protein [Methylococcales bacterium]MBT7408885.1 hypothetical protein [Methylococcales bacterium]
MSEGSSFFAAHKSLSRQELLTELVTHWNKKESDKLLLTFHPKTGHGIVYINSKYDKHAPVTGEYINASRAGFIQFSYDSAYIMNVMTSREKEMKQLIEILVKFRKMHRKLYIESELDGSNLSFWEKTKRYFQ